MDSYRDLRVWQSAMRLSVAVYQTTDKFPKHELFGLVQQIRRCAVSVPSNIAEGKGRRTSRDFAHFLFQARGSLLELETQLLLAEQLQYISEQDTASLLKEAAVVGRALTGLINALEPNGRPAESRKPRAES